MHDDQEMTLTLLICQYNFCIDADEETHNLDGMFKSA